MVHTIHILRKIISSSILEVDVEHGEISYVISLSFIYSVSHTAHSLSLAYGDAWLLFWDMLCVPKDFLYNIK